jgi:putative transposase
VTGKRNGFRPRHLQTAEGELRIEIPQVRETAIPFVSKLSPKWHCERLLRTDPLKALVIGGFVRGLSMRDVESLCEEAGLGRTSKSTVATICAELRERFQAFGRRSLYDVNLVVLFLDAIYLPVRPSGPKEGVICAWGIDENGHRALVSVRLGARESKEDWTELGRDLIARGLAAPRLVVADGAPGLIAAVEEIWPRADRQHCAVHRLRNLLAKLPKSEQDRIRFNYWSALTDATRVKDGKTPPPGPHLRARAPRLRVRRPLPRRGPRRARCAPALPPQAHERWRSTNLLERSLGEVRRRTNVMGRFPGETSRLSLVWAVLDLFFSHASNGATFTDVDRQHLYRIKYRQADPDTLDEEVTAA